MDTVFLLATIFFGVVALKDLLTILFLLIIGSRLEQDETEKREGKYLLRTLLCTYLFVGYEWLIPGDYRKKMMMWSLFISSLVLWARHDQRFLTGVVLLGWHLLYRFLIPIVPRFINRPDWQAYNFLLAHRICFFSVLIVLLGVCGVSMGIGGTILLLLLLLYGVLDSWLWKTRESL